MFSQEKYVAVLNATSKKEGKSKETLYKEIGNAIYADPNTVKSWARPQSTGPSENALIEDLEKALGLDLGTLGRREEKPKKAQSEVKGMSEFSKKAAYKCYKLMKDYIHDDAVENEECFTEMYMKVDQYKIALPESLFTKIQECIDTHLAPIIYEYDTTFAKCHSPELGEFDEDGTFHLKDEESTRKCCTYFLLTLLDIERAVDKWAMENLQPLLVS